ncbi:MAG: hypothetical protein IIX93_13095, partial [Clostridia bacterium]|nr:hypothetical protein [Clostridia bacterium]
GRHKAVPAFEIASSRDGPMHFSFIAAGIQLVFLFWEKHVSEGGFADDFVLQRRVEEALHLLRKLVSVYTAETVALCDQSKSFFIEKDGPFSHCVKNGIGDLLPAAQAVSLKNIALFLS